MRFKQAELARSEKLKARQLEKQQAADTAHALLLAKKQRLEAQALDAELRQVRR